MKFKNLYEMNMILSLVKDGCATVNTTDIYAENELILESGQDSPESEVIKADLFSRLSADAKFILRTIFNSPVELMEIAKQRGNNQNKLASYLRKMWKSTLRTKKVMKEIERYNTELQE
jgi:hypothetical protein